MTDMGLSQTESVLLDLRLKAGETKNLPTDELRASLVKIIEEKISISTIDPFAEPHPKAIILVGVNGTGKTTSLAKLAKIALDRGLGLVVGAGDTFRAAADKQLSIWAERLKVDIVSHQIGGDPAAVVHDAIAAAKSRKKEIILIDTAGRLHNDRNLMEEIKKIKRVSVRELGDDAVITLMVIDATTGQNGIVQAKEFNEALSLDGIILTKLDGSAKGGVVVAIAGELGIPILYVGQGEGLLDMSPFDPKEYSSALFGEGADV